MDENDVKTFSWNVHGLNCAARREAVRLLLQQVRPQIICLQETKLAEVNFSVAMEFLGAPYCSSFAYLPAEETRGGVLIAWTKTISLEGLQGRTKDPCSVKHDCRCKCLTRSRT
jgi:exonuclease III